MNYPCNLLLYGPPGTGKTFNTVNYTVGIIEDRPIEEVQKDNYDKNLEKYNRYTEMGRVNFMTFHQAMSYDEFIEGIKPVVVNGNVQYEARPGMFYKFCKMAENPPLCDDFDDKGRCVFVIDEINRGNVSNIFGELITLLESSRRQGKKECLRTHLALMDEFFSVPQNVYIMGTMNSSDKSLTSLDAALRRRFEFVEMLPNP